MICKSYSWLLIFCSLENSERYFFFYFIMCFDLCKFFIFMRLICWWFPLWLLGVESSVLGKGIPTLNLQKSFFPLKILMILFFI